MTIDTELRCGQVLYSVKYNDQSLYVLILALSIGIASQLYLIMYIIYIYIFCGFSTIIQSCLKILPRSGTTVFLRRALRGIIFIEKYTFKN